MPEDTLNKPMDQHLEEPLQVGNIKDTGSPLGEKFDARKMVIYSEIMNPKYKD